MRLLSDEELERSAVVANCRMNRERDLLGSNGYDRALGLDPLAFLRTRVEEGRPAAWLDLCCGTGKALIWAAEVLQAKPRAVEIVGVDLVGMFHRPSTGLGCLRLVEASLSGWRPDWAFDLITCVHGLHYVGDKLGLIARTASWLVGDGMFAGNLDLRNLKVGGEPRPSRRITADLRRAGLTYDSRRCLVFCPGLGSLNLPYRYLGADDQAGPNYTGQPAVDSYYELAEGAGR
jgi:SAM-dependent methyltransferase